MKAKMIVKLVLAAAVVCAAVGARADNLYWSISGITPTSSSTYLSYLFIDSATSSFSGSTPKTTSVQSVLSMLYDGTLWDKINDYKLSNSSGKNSGGTISFSPTDSTAQVGQSNQKLSVFALIVDGSLDSKASNAAKNYMIAKSATTGEALLSYTTQGNSSSYKYTFDWGSQATAGNSWNSISSIPEPTSGILLLVGIATLALRRKKAA